MPSVTSVSFFRPLQVEAEDADAVDAKGLVYSVGGDGLQAPDALFNINPHTGHLLQLKVRRSCCPFVPLGY